MRGRCTFVARSSCACSYLPLAHIFERTVEHLMLARGASIGFNQGEVSKLMEDIARLRPTMMPGVPRIFNKLYAGIKSNVRTTIAV